MRRMTLAVGILAVAGLAAVVVAEAKPTTIRLSLDGIVAHIAFENGDKLALTSKPTPIRPGTYWTKSLQVFRKDDKGKTWELRGTNDFGGYSSITVDPEQDKVLILGKMIRFELYGGPYSPKGYLVVSIKIRTTGLSGEVLLPGAIPEGKAFTPPGITISSPDGKVLAQLVAQLDKDIWSVEWRVPPGYTGAYKADINAVTGPYEFTVTRSLDPVPQGPGK